MRVVLRCRPISSGETKEGRRLVVQVDEAARQVVLHAARAGDVETRAFSFDAAFGSDSSQQKVIFNKRSMIIRVSERISALSATATG